MSRHWIGTVTTQQSRRGPWVRSKLVSWMIRWGVPSAVALCLTGAPAGSAATSQEPIGLGSAGWSDSAVHTDDDWSLRPISAIRLSTTTPDWLADLVKEARDEWAGVDPRLFVPIVETLPGLENVHHRPTSDPSHVGETNLRSDGEPTVVIWPKHEDAYSVVLHELGHALCGCGVHLPQGVMRAKSNVMRQFVSAGDAEMIALRRLDYFRQQR